MDSVISRSQSLSSSGTVNKELIEGTYGVFDALFPIYEQISKVIHIPSPFYYLMIIIITIQIFTQSLWARKLLSLSSSGRDDQIIRKLNEYFLLNDPLDPYKINYIGFYVIIAVFFLSLLIFFSVFIQYKLTISFNIAFLYIFRGYFDIVVPVFILPSIGYGGQFLVSILKKEMRFANIVLSIISIIIAATLYTSYFMHFSILANSPYFSRGPISTVRGSYFTSLIFMVFIVEIGQYILELFPKWASIIGAFSTTAVFIYLAVRNNVLPFFAFSTNVVFSSLYTTFASVNFIEAIQGIYKLHNSVPLIMLPVIFIICCIIYNFVFKSIKSKVKKQLNTIPEESRESMQIVADEFDRLDLCMNMNRYLKFLIVSLETANEVFLNNAIFKYGFDRYQDLELDRVLLIYAAQIPGFNRILSLAYATFFKNAKLTFINRFLIYTILRLVTMRQSSSSQQFSQRVIEVRQESKKCRDYIRGFLLQTPSKVSTFYTFYKEAQATEYRWTELINHYPNSSKVYDEYGDFLIEVMTDFHESTIQKHKTTLLEDGHRLHKDHVFINFIHWHQHYLKRGIVDLHGQVMDQKKKIQSTNSTQTTKSGSTSTQLTSLSQLLEIAPEEEEFYAKALFSQAKLRLAFQRAIEERRSKSSTPLKICIFLIMVFSLAVLILSDTIVSDFFVQRASSLSKVKFINYARFYMSCSRFASLLYFATQNDFYHIDDNVRNKGIKDIGMKPYISFTGDFREQAIQYNQLSIEYYNKFISEIVSYAMDGHGIYYVGQPFLEQRLNSSFCSRTGEVLNKTVKTSVHALFSYNNIINDLIYTQNVEEWNQSKVFCNVISNEVQISKGLDDFNDNELGAENDDTLANSHQILIYQIAFPVALLVVNIILFVIPMTTYYFSLKRTLEVLQQIHQKVKEEACKNIGKSNMDDTGAVSPPESKVFFFAFFTGIILIIIVPIFVFVSFNEAKSVNKKFESLIGWMNMGGARGPLLSEAMEHLTLAALAKQKALSFINDVKELKTTEDFVDEAMQFHNIMTEGTNVTEPCIGFDDTLDDLQYANICAANKESMDMHERYRCSSLSAMFGFVKSILDDVLVRFDSIENLDDTIFTELFHMMNTHMFKRLSDVSERIDELGQNNKKKFEILSLIICVIGCILAVFVFIIHIYMAIQLDYMYKAAMIIFRRIPPLYITQNHDLMDFLLNRQKKGSGETMTFSQNILFSSQNGVLLVNKAGIVEMVNESVNDILGYVPDQILGQQALILFVEKDGQKVQQQLDLMHNGEAKDVFDDHFECISDDTSVKQCHVTILGLDGQETGEINSYVFIIADESQILHKQEQAELAKKKSEELLFQILPRDIVFKLNQGERDITFTVPSATVMFIDIVRFSDYAANLTPQQIMGNLSLIFDTFDKHLQEYPLITKIKLIGDVYMCAAGLFNPDGQPVEHAQQMLHFAIDCLQEIENINVALESMLSVRIGVNTGGPLIGGILGTDKPVFDIIGDPINVAARLQSTDIPGKIQIPQTVYDLVHSLDFNIEKRGEVYLKGKGNVMTYLVSPVNIFNMASNNITSSMMLISIKNIN